MASDEYDREVSLKLSSKLLDDLTAQAAKQGVSRSELLRQYAVCGLTADRVRERESE